MRRRWTRCLQPSPQLTNHPDSPQLTPTPVQGIALPSDREYDGIDISSVLLNGSEHGHTTLFHPNSGASGIPGKLDGVRWNQYKVSPDANSLVLQPPPLQPFPILPTPFFAGADARVIPVPMLFPLR